MRFRFKKFDIIHENSAMKVGTDGVLLGAWADYPNPKTILDIGTGTGLIALMLAQRFNKAVITALEIDRDSAQEAKQNFVNSKWNDRIQINETDFFKYDESNKFDLLVCNPPFFRFDLRSPDKKRAMARNGSKSGKSFLEKASFLMHENSQVSFIIPNNLLEDYLRVAKLCGMHKLRTLFIKPTELKPPNRVLVTFGFRKENDCDLADNYLIIEVGGRHKYSNEYKNLTKDFYLRF